MLKMAHIKSTRVIQVIWLQLVFRPACSCLGRYTSDLCMKHFPPTVILANILFSYHEYQIKGKGIALERNYSFLVK